MATPRGWSGRAWQGESGPPRNAINPSGGSWRSIPEWIDDCRLLIFDLRRKEEDFALQSLQKSTISNHQSPIEPPPEFPLSKPPKSRHSPGVSPTDSLIRGWLARAVHHPDFFQRLAPLATGDGGVVFDHAAEASHAFLTALVIRAAKEQKKSRLWLVSDLPRHRERLAAELELWGVTALILPDAPPPDSNDAIADPESAAEWFSVLEILARASQCCVICGSEAFASRAPSPQTLCATRTPLQPGTALDPLVLAATLTDHDYERVPTVTGRGQFAVRGGVLDVFAWQASRPLRLEFFDTELESVREFDLNTQASTAKLTEAELLLAEPAADATVANYRQPGDLVISYNAGIARPDLRILEDAAEFNTEEDFTLATYGSPLGTFEAGDFVLEQAHRDHFFRQLNEWRNAGWEVGMVFGSKGEEERFAELAG